MVINHNEMAANTARNLNSHYGRLQTSTQRLSTGLRINSAADDAAGLAIRELMRSDIASLNQGVRNANDAISLIQVADGALGIIDEKLIRMKELAEQAATGTYNSDQRLMINSEFQAMGAEIDRIAFATNFNGQYLLDGSRGFGHNGSGLEATGKFKIHFGTANDSAEDYYYIGIGDASLRGLGLAAPTPDWWNASEIDFENRKILIDLESVVAGKTSPNGVPGMPGIDFFNLPVGLKNITVTSSNAGSFAHKPHVNLFTREGTQLTGVPVDGSWGGTLQVWEDVQGAPGGGQWINVPADCYDPTAGNPTLKPEYVDNTQNPPFTQAFMDLFAGQNIDFNQGLHYDGMDSDTWWNNMSGAQVIAIGQNSGIFNPDATYKGDNSSVISAAGETVTAGGATITIKSNMNEISGAAEVIEISEITDDLVFMIGGHETGHCNNYKLKIEADFDDNFISMLAEHRSTGAIGIGTQEKAQLALPRIGDAIVKKDQIRANLGSMQNRLENTVSNLTIQSENLQASESRISDTDVATEMTQFVRNQILTQSAVAMLSQANSLPQMAMQLIG